MPKRRVIRETRYSVFERGVNRPVKVELRDGMLYVWLKGLRRRYAVDMGAAWQRAVKAEVEAERREKRQRRKR